MPHAERKIAASFASAARHGPRHEGDRERLLESSGADGYLEKPVYDSAVLVEKVRSLIENVC
jgi:CheY-like chemotaxis protein